MNNLMLESGRTVKYKTKRTEKKKKNLSYEMPLLDHCETETALAP